VSKNITTVKARLINPPELMYLNKSNRTITERPASGSWNMRDKKVIQGGVLASWGILCLVHPRTFGLDAFRYFATELVRILKDSGLRVDLEKPPLHYLDDSRSSIADAVQFVADAGYQLTKKRPQLVVCIKETNCKDEYAEIKRASDCNIGVPSQCVLLKHVWDCKAQYLANVGLKINQKLGGRCTYTSGFPGAWLGKDPMMVFGADVTHFPREGGKPSIAAMVGSMDDKFVQYASSMKFQSHVTETMEFGGEMFTDLLKEFKKRNNVLPSRVVFYRDGVASSQFGMVLGVELKDLKKAAAELQTGYNPKFTYIVLQKRHHLRIFPKDPRDADKSGNVKPGLVVDSDIVHPYENDFYLMSQASLKGTSKPSRYVILRDENNFTPDEIQTFTFHQCFTFGRATKAVSCVPAVYYSHLLAFRGRHMLVDIDDHSSISSGSGGQRRPQYEYHKFSEDSLREMFYV